MTAGRSLYCLLPQGVSKAELARRLGSHLPQVHRALDVQHRSGLGQMDAALGAIEQRLHVTTAPVVEEVNEKVEAS